jgi:hypothetical protein
MRYMFWTPLEEINQYGKHGIGKEIEHVFSTSVESIKDYSSTLGVDTMVLVKDVIDTIYLQKPDPVGAVSHSLDFAKDLMEVPPEAFDKNKVIHEQVNEALKEKQAQLDANQKILSEEQKDINSDRESLNKERAQLQKDFDPIIHESYIDPVTHEKLSQEEKDKQTHAFNEKLVDLDMRTLALDNKQEKLDLLKVACDSVQQDIDSWPGFNIHDKEGKIINEQAKAEHEKLDRVHRDMALVHESQTKIDIEIAKRNEKARDDQVQIMEQHKDGPTEKRDDNLSTWLEHPSKNQKEPVAGRRDLGREPKEKREPPPPPREHRG